MVLTWLPVDHRATCATGPGITKNSSAAGSYWICSGLGSSTDIAVAGAAGLGHWLNPDHGCHPWSQREPPLEIRHSQATGFPAVPV